MIGRYLSADDQRKGKIGMLIGGMAMPGIALNLARQDGLVVAMPYAIGMAVLLTLIGFQIRASHLRDEKTNG